MTGSLTAKSYNVMYSAIRETCYYLAVSIIIVPYCFNMKLIVSFHYCRNINVNSRNYEDVGIIAPLVT